MDQELLKILACPACRGALEALELPDCAKGAALEQGPADDDDESAGGVLPGKVESGLFCAACATVYPVSGGIPVMLREEAVPRNLWELGQLQKNNKRRK